VSKKRRDMKHGKLRRASPHPLGFGGRNVSPSARAIGERIARAGPGYIKHNFVRIMRDCHILREEPEFRDLLFDIEKTAKVSLSALNRYKQRLEKAAEAKGDRLQQVYDEARIEAIDKLTTREFRRDFFRRLDRCVERLKYGNDAKKLEMALFLMSLLQAKDVPWGLCGLITTIYEITRERAVQQAEEDLELFGEFLEAAEKGFDFEALATMAHDPKRIADFSKKLEAKPGLHERLQLETRRLLQDFEANLGRGEVELDLFTEEELLRSFQYMAEHVQAEEVDLAAADPKRLSKKFFGFIQQSIRETMTPERAAQMKVHLEQVSKKWLAARNPQGALLQIEISNLDDTEHSQNPFLYAAYLGQVHKMGETVSMTLAAKESAAPAGSTMDAKTAPRSRRGLTDRMRDLFGKGCPN